jgi:hypothetical protein
MTTESDKAANGQTANGGTPPPTPPPPTAPARRDWKETLFSWQKVVAAIVAIAAAGWGFWLWLQPNLPARVQVNLTSCRSELIELEALNTGGQSVPVGPPRFRIETPRQPTVPGSAERGVAWDIDSYLEERESLGMVRRVPPPGEDRQPGLVRFRYTGGGDEFFNSDDARPELCTIYVTLPVQGADDESGHCPCVYP